MLEELKDAFVKSKQIKCISCGKYKNKEEFLKLRYANSRVRHHCGYCLNYPRYVGENSYYVGSQKDATKSYSPAEMSIADINKLKSFMENPVAYSTGSNITKQKIEYLVVNVRPKLIGSELINFDIARQKYQKSLKERDSTVSVPCPKCDSRMARRAGRYGAFWGCIRYPLCNGTRNI